MKIFISHSHSEKQFARKLSDRIRDMNFQIWIDEEEIHIGESLIYKITEGLNTVDLVIVILSTNSINSSWVQEELDFALNKQITESKIIVLPILVEKVELPLFLKGKKCISFIEEQDFEKNLKALISDIEYYLKKKNNSYRIVLSESMAFELKQEILQKFKPQNSYQLRLLEREDNFEKWNTNFFEGFLSACKCYLDMLNDIRGITFTSEEIKEELACYIPFVMGMHVIELLESKRFIEDYKSNLPNKDMLDEAWKNFEFDNSGFQTSYIFKWCPEGDYKSFYFGWKLFCYEVGISLFKKLQIFREHKIGKSLKLDEIEMLIYESINNTIQGHISKFNETEYQAWQIVRFYIQYLLGIIQKYEFIKLEKHFSSVEELDYFFGMNEESKQELKNLQKHYINDTTAVEIILLRLQTQYKFENIYPKLTKNFTFQFTPIGM